jgi:hypothetical protein
VIPVGRATRIERAFLIVAGIVTFLYGSWWHQSRGTLAVTLVVIGAVFTALGVILPYVQGLEGTVAGVTVQIALAQLPAPISGEPLGALRGDVVPDSGSEAFVQLLRSSGPRAYAVISLGDGRQWLTSRLLVFAVVLQELRDLRCLVFTSWLGEDAEDRIVGTVTPDELRRAFALHYPWLEAALAEATEEILYGNPVGDHSRTLTPMTADRLLHAVVTKLGPVAGVPPVEAEWANIRGRLEHARWVDLPTLGNALGGLLNHHLVTAESVTDVSPDAVLAAGGAFVPVVDHDKRFVALLDRLALLEARAGQRG